MSAATMILAVDAGHTRIKFAAVAGDSTGLPAVCHHIASMHSEGIDWRLIDSWRDGADFRHSVVTGSSPPAVQRVLQEWPRDWPPPHQVRDKSQLPIRSTVLHPEKVGIDRLLNAIAANRIRQEHQTAIIVDTGTAVTVDCVGSEGVFRGGAILPGVRMSAQALHGYTSTLPHVDASRMFDRVPPPIGTHTEPAIESGLYWGHVGAVRELILRLRDELASIDPAKDDNSLVLITGGAAPLLKPHFAHARFEPHLSLQGLAHATHMIFSGQPAGAAGT